MNVQELGFQELSINESRKVDGGALPWYTLVAIAVAAKAVYDAGNGMIDGWTDQAEEGVNW